MSVYKSTDAEAHISEPVQEAGLPPNPLYVVNDPEKAVLDILGLCKPR